MLFLLIGLIVGLIIGMTGAGGALIAIPLFQILIHLTVKEATVLSLITVLLASGANLISRWKEIKWKAALGFAIAGTVANFLTVALKDKISETIIVGLLVALGIISILSVWRSPDLKSERRKTPSIFFVLLAGLLLGFVTTLTGLGGGVLLIPLLFTLFGLNYEEALPTSLATIFLISLSALILQRDRVLELITFSEIVYVAIGAIISFVFLKNILSLVSREKILIIRKYVFILATIISLSIVILKTL